MKKTGWLQTQSPEIQSLQVHAVHRVPTQMSRSNASIYESLIDMDSVLASQIGLVTDLAHESPALILSSGILGLKFFEDDALSCFANDCFDWLVMMEEIGC